MYTYFIYIKEIKTWKEVTEAEFKSFEGKKIRTA